MAITKKHGGRVLRISYQAPGSRAILSNKVVVTLRTRHDRFDALTISQHVVTAAEDPSSPELIEVFEVHLSHELGRPHRLIYFESYRAGIAKEAEQPARLPSLFPPGLACVVPRQIARARYLRDLALLNPAQPQVGSLPQPGC